MDLDVAGIAHREVLVEENAIRIALANADGQGVMLRIPGSFIGGLILALAAEGGRLQRGQPDPDSQVTFPATGCELGVTDAGDPILILELVGGMALPIVLESAALSSLSSALALLQKEQDGPPH